MKSLGDRHVLAFILGWLATLVGLPLLTAWGMARAEGQTVAAVLCAPGLTPPVLVATAWFVLATVLGLLLVRRSDRLAALVRLHGMRLWLLGGLVLLPGWLAWATQSSACKRGPAFFWESIFIETFILALLAVSYNLIFGFAGILSFGHAAFFGLGAYTTGLLIKHLNWPLGGSVGAALLLAAVLALFMSIVALRVRGLYFALFSLALAEILHLLAANRVMVHITGAEDGFVFTVPDWINPVKHRLLFYYLALVSLALAFAFVYRLIHSPTGRVLLALRDNEDRAQMLGFSPFAYKTFALVISGVMAGYAGVLRALLNKGASPNVLGLDFTMDPLLMTILGGTATFEGPVAGAFLLRMVEHLLRDTTLTFGAWQFNIGEHWALVLGVLFILVVLAFPQGLMGLPSRGRRRKRTRFLPPRSG